MAEKRILFLAPASIPVNGAESIVNVKVIKLLVAKGYKIDLISKHYIWDHYPTTQDEELQAALASITTIKVSNKLSLNTLWLHFRAWARFGVLFKGIHWAFLASKRVEQLMASNKYECIMTKNIPSEVVGNWAKRRYGIPWVATWNDPYPHERYPEPYGKGPQAPLWLLKKPLVRQMRNADAHIFPSQRLRDYMLSYLGCNTAQTYVIPHIVEPLSKKDRTPNSVLKVCYMGSLDGPRKPWTTLDAIRDFKKQNPYCPVRFDFICPAPAGMADRIKEYGIDDIVSVYPPVSYSRSLELLYEYDVALIIEAQCKEGIFLPSKVSDAMAVGLSVFAISPSVGVMHDLYEKGHVQYFADVSDPKSITESIERLVSDFKSGCFAPLAVPSDYLALTVGEQYDGIMDKIRLK